MKWEEYKGRNEIELLRNLKMKLSGYVMVYDEEVAIVLEMI